MTNETMKSKWIQTDTLQWVKTLNNSTFMVLNGLNENSVLSLNEQEINLNEYSEEELEEAIFGYYDSLDEVKATYKEDWKQIVAECIVEQSNNKTFQTTDLNEASSFLLNKYGIEKNFEEV